MTDKIAPVMAPKIDPRLTLAREDLAELLRAALETAETSIKREIQTRRAAYINRLLNTLVNERDEALNLAAARAVSGAP